MVDIETNITINAPLHKVVSYASNPENAPEWYVNIKSAKWVGENTLKVGAKIAFIAKFLGKELSYVYQITELSDIKMVMQTSDGPFPMKTTYSWQQVDNTTTQMTLRNTGQPKGFSRLMAPLMKPAMKKANIKDLKLLKKILEEAG